MTNPRSKSHIQVIPQLNVDDLRENLPPRSYKIIADKADVHVDTVSKVLRNERRNLKVVRAALEYLKENRQEIEDLNQEIKDVIS